MRVDDFDFHLPPELIAQRPPAERDGARMLTVDRQSGALADRHFLEFPSLLRPGDLLVMNDSRVIPARLFGRRAGLHTQRSSPAPSGSVEVLLTQPLGNDTWRALVKPGRKVPVGERIFFGDTADASSSLVADVVEAGDFGERTLRFQPVADFFDALERLGQIPLPPYIHRDVSSDEDDRARYQTVYAGERGSAAAPTAGLHFTPEVLAAIRAMGVHIAHVTLHVGLGTFQPVRAADLANIHLHEESYGLPAATAMALQSARAEGRRIVAVGTTTTRTLEHVAQTQQLHPHTGTTNIFLQPGHRFQLVDALLTNFHLPQSTLLMLVSAFAGRESVLQAYRHAVDERYRFFSYGDCMFLS
ncbi:MAG: tRNA preQ1(34) S-adenosylmethionine ribosyltransferase-isomerase QueA [Janthinobacterium lividum]